MRLVHSRMHFVQDAKAIVGGYDTALEHIQAAKRGATSILRVGFLYGACFPFIVDASRRFRKSCPDTALAMRSLEIHEVLNALDIDAIDFGLMPVVR